MYFEIYKNMSVDDIIVLSNHKKGERWGEDHVKQWLAWFSVNENEKNKILKLAEEEYKSIKESYCSKEDVTDQDEQSFDLATDDYNKIVSMVNTGNIEIYLKAETAVRETLVEYIERTYPNA